MIRIRMFNRNTMNFDVLRNTEFEGTINKFLSKVEAIDVVVINFDQIIVKYCENTDKEQIPFASGSN